MVESNANTESRNSYKVVLAREKVIPRIIIHMISENNIQNNKLKAQENGDTFNIIEKQIDALVEK